MVNTLNTDTMKNWFMTENGTLSKVRISGAVIGAVLSLIIVFFMLPKKQKIDSTIPLMDSAALPAHIKAVLHELEKEEYIGLTQQEIERKLTEKGIPH